MKIMLRATLALGLVVSVPAMAADADGRFALRSLATLSCGQVVDAIERSEGEDLQTLVSQLSIWLGGYLTHANRVTPDVFDIVPFGAERDVLAVIVNRCEQLPPETNFEAAAASVVSVLSSLAVPQESPLRNLEGILPLRESTIVRVQERLIALGHLEGAADGVVGPMTRAAIVAFQEARGAQNTGFLDIDGFLALMAGEAP